MRPSSRAFVLAALAVSIGLAAPGAAWAQQAAPVVPNPGARDMFQLNDLASYRQFATVKNFEIVGMGAGGSRPVRLTAQPGHRGLDWARDHL